MIKRLTIRNYALIRSLEFEPSPKLNVITGETGAGKSIILGALGLLLGNRADTRTLWDENEKCITEAEFDIKNYGLQSLFKECDLDYSDQTLVRREISPGGKSRAFINDTPVTLDVMKRVGSMLVDIHSQHETLQLASRRFQLGLIDTYAGNKQLVDKYEEQWAAFQSARGRSDELEKESARLKEEADYINFQLDELNKANLQSHELDELEGEGKRLEHTEEIKSHLEASLELLQHAEFSSISSLSEIRTHLLAIAGFSPALQTLSQRLDSMLIELRDVASEIEREQQNTEFDPERAHFVRERLDLIYRLLSKHHSENIEGLLRLQTELERQAKLTANIDESIVQSKKEVAATLAEVNRLAAELTLQRKGVFKSLCKQLTTLLHQLGIPEVQLTIDHLPTEPGPHGADDIELLFSANKGIAPRPLAQVASGGEFSRLMFSIKYVMAEKTAMPTLILDEIDHGISGEVAMQMGNLMKHMASSHQLITITHLPQIAARGDCHFFVFKDNSAHKTVSSIRSLAPDQRVEEIARMIGGDAPSKIAVENARELLYN